MSKRTPKIIPATAAPRREVDARCLWLIRDLPMMLSLLGTVGSDECSHQSGSQVAVRVCHSERCLARIFATLRPQNGRQGERGISSSSAGTPRHARGDTANQCQRGPGRAPVEARRAGPGQGDGAMCRRSVRSPGPYFEKLNVDKTCRTRSWLAVSALLVRASAEKLVAASSLLIWVQSSVPSAFLV